MNTFGNKFRITLSGESHSPSIGVTLEGVPPGIPISLDELIAEIERRKPGEKGTTTRKESDTPHIIRGIEDGVTTGGSIRIVFHNRNIRPEDYRQFAEIPRPGHADMVRLQKYPAEKFTSGGGIFSGRMTLPLVAGGFIAKKIIAPVEITSEFVSIGKIEIPEQFSKSPHQYPLFEKYLEEIVRANDSIGGIIRCTCRNIPVGLGEPFFESVESRISHLIFSIPGVRGIEFGDGFASTKMLGSEHNDPIGPDARPQKNGAGGVNGGITNGAPIVFRAAFKPTSSIRKAQQTFNFATGQMDELVVPGRHDACFALRAPIVVEAMTAIALADLVLMAR